VSSSASCHSAPEKLGKTNLSVAICGNPNSGKTTLFNALTGLSQKVANYPGVTVEKVVGTFSYGASTFRLLDVPGAYSLTAYSPDEAIAAAALLGRHTGEPRPDVIVVVVDATNIERGLYLISQVLELSTPTVVALNMFDLAQRRGLRIDHRQLSSEIGAPVVPLVAHRGEGITALQDALLKAVSMPSPRPVVALPDSVDSVVDAILHEANSNGHEPISRGEAVRLLFDEQGYFEERALRDRAHYSAEKKGRAELLPERLAAFRKGLESVGGAGLETRVRTTWAGQLADRIVESPTGARASWTSRLDRIMLHRVWGPLIMIVLMIGVFQSIFSWAQPIMELVDTAFTKLAAFVGASLPVGPLNSLITDGIIGGVGSVLIFLPQIMILFFFIGVLEDSGYMPRAAFLVDRLFKGCGLSGRSFIPLLSSFACAVPGIMATRTINDRRQRFLTIIVAPLMTCSARLPVYAIMIAAFIPVFYIGIFNVQGLTLAALYVLGIFVAANVALVLKHTVLKGPTASFVMELPSYKIPKWSNVFIQMYQRGRAFVTRAGTVILALAIVIWALSYYPRSSETTASYDARMAAAQTEPEKLELQRELDGELLRNSYLGQFGRLLEPASIHLGWDWKITMAAVAAFPAREVIIATMGTIYNLGAEGVEDETTLINKMRSARWDHGPLQGQPVFNIPVAASIMVFFALCCQCMATLATIRRETNSWRWPVFVFTYMTVLAIAGAYAVYHLGLSMGLGSI
jgi:ferrous iron transport protein B